MEQYLKIKSIWEDDSLFEVRVTASNGRFSGQADCYTNREHIGSLASLIEGFPTKVGQEVEFTTGESDDLSYFTLALKCIDGSGHITARVKVAHIVTYTNTPQEKDFAEFEFGIEASAIDTFVRNIKRLAKAKIGEINAKLNGKT
ncbi:hypothetical protein [Zhongshania marina]|uniref:Uncharacterized protein n=1 Tax=Zhongshania marina TaxID=2304603 RepID=A0ABX9W503_9GAMM|nr:hypothetical protein D0911_07825 [Zhongshania marina]